ncbi:hypothetical protein BD310DRAFT_21760 [Dichomitus squalens]|uniref:Uncharacterized protein n=1 Tax=Dichomitus squalens TaxID=114155 RepID=A0A4Q9QET8_9APHY|nr:hypothetical protein BD310DRAFT_21760 [Dichomitus squalens]
MCIDDESLYFAPSHIQSTHIRFVLVCASPSLSPSLPPSIALLAHSPPPPEHSCIYIRSSLCPCLSRSWVAVIILGLCLLVHRFRSHPLHVMPRHAAYHFHPISPRTHLAPSSPRPCRISRIPPPTSLLDHTRTFR